MAVVTISRKVGSLGDEIGALVARKLGYELVNREGIHRIARECDLEFRDACAAFEAETAPGGLWERMFFRDPAYACLFEALNLELASRGDVVILGRGAQIALAEVPGVFHARVVAPAGLRAERVAQRMGLSLDEAREFVRHYDQQRRSLIESVYHRDLADWSLYNLVLNTANLSAEAGAELIALAAKAMPPVNDPQAVSQELARRAFAKKVESAIKKRVLTSPYHDVRVQCPLEGKVRLEGFVQDRDTRRRVGEIAQKYPGVIEVDNQLRTTALSF